ncbi:hypothetical protein [Jatrophihabitans sp.]|nr:hypothetical protein [Jatrophihabitans sp.]
MTEFYGLNTEALNAAVDYRRSVLLRSARRPVARAHWWRALTGR